MLPLTKPDTARLVSLSTAGSVPGVLSALLRSEPFIISSFLKCVLFILFFYEAPVASFIYLMKDFSTS